jgi:biotin synthase-related radical SAM superfamily protein
VINFSLENKSPLLVRKNSKLFLGALCKIPLNDYEGLTLNGGMTSHSGRGMEIIEPVVREIKNVYPSLDIAVEITPPKNLKWIDKLKNAGVSSLMMNIECWDESIRKEIIPGKNRLCSKDTYLKAFEHSIEIFGKGKVTSCFVVGTEKIESLKEGAGVLTDLNVIPSPLAGRYFEDSANHLFDPKVNFHELLDLMVYINKLMYEKKLTSGDRSGCIACGMCDLTKDKEFF